MARVSLIAARSEDGGGDDDVEGDGAVGGTDDVDGEADDDADGGDGDDVFWGDDDADGESDGNDAFWGDADADGESDGNDAFWGDDDADGEGEASDEFWGDDDGDGSDEFWGDDDRDGNADVGGNDDGDADGDCDAEGEGRADGDGASEGCKRARSRCLPPGRLSEAKTWLRHAASASRDRHASSVVSHGARRPLSHSQALVEHCSVGWRQYCAALLPLLSGSRNWVSRSASMPDVCSSSMAGADAPADGGVSVATAVSLMMMSGRPNGCAWPTTPWNATRLLPSTSSIWRLPCGCECGAQATVTSGSTSGDS